MWKYLQTIPITVTTDLVRKDHCSTGLNFLPPNSVFRPVIGTKKGQGIKV